MNTNLFLHGGIYMLIIWNGIAQDGIDNIKINYTKSNERKNRNKYKKIEG